MLVGKTFIFCYSDLKLVNCIVSFILLYLFATDNLAIWKLSFKALNYQRRYGLLLPIGTILLQLMGIVLQYLSVLIRFVTERLVFRL